MLSNYTIRVSLQQPSEHPEFEAPTCVEAIQEGSPEWEAAFARHFLPRIRAYASRALPKHPAVDDVLQDCLWASIQALRQGKLADPANLASFVYSIAKHRVMDVYRQDSRSRSEPLTDELTLNIVFQDALIEKDKERVAAEAIGKMEPIDRQILSLLLLRGLNYSQISDKLRLDIAAVRQRKSRALRRLTEKLSQTPRLKRLT